MAFAGLHVACVYNGNAGTTNQKPLIGKPAWSQTMGAAGTSSQTAPKPVPGAGDPIFEVSVSADSFVAIGPIPDATAGPRLFLQGGTTTDIYVAEGDKLAWVAA